MRIFQRNKNNIGGNPIKDRNSTGRHTQRPNLSEPAEEIYIKQVTIKSPQDFLLLKNELMKGNIMIANIESLVKIANGPTKDNRPLRQQLQYMKKYCLQYGGSIAKLGNGVLLISPNDQIQF